MSRKNPTRKSMHGQHHVPRVAPALSAQELEERWNSLCLQARTKDHLEHLLKIEGLDLAVAATIALSLELKPEEQKVARSLWGWVVEELRLLFLEEGCAHFIESGHVIGDAILTWWTFMQGPALVASLDLLVIAVGVLLISCCLSCFPIRVRRPSCAARWRQNA